MYIGNIYHLLKISLNIIPADFIIIRGQRKSVTVYKLYIFLYFFAIKHKGIFFLHFQKQSTHPPFDEAASLSTYSVLCPLYPWTCCRLKKAFEVNFSASLIVGDNIKV